VDAAVSLTEEASAMPRPPSSRGASGVISASLRWARSATTSARWTLAARGSRAAPALAKGRLYLREGPTLACYTPAQ